MRLLSETTHIDEAVRFDRLAPWYDLSIKPAELVIDRRRRQLLAQARGDILELGVGTGQTLRLYPPDRQLTGIDPSEQMLERARRKAHRLGLQVDLRLMSAETLDFLDASFGTVVSSLVFCSVDDPSRALAEAHRVLRAGGQLLMIEHVRPHGGLGRLFDLLDPWFYQQSCHLNRRTPEDVRQAGFGVVRDERWLFGVFNVLQASRAEYSPLASAIPDGRPMIHQSEPQPIAPRGNAAIGLGRAVWETLATARALNASWNAWPVGGLQFRGHPLARNTHWIGVTARTV